MRWCAGHKRQGQACVLEPPCAEVYHQVESVIGVRQLPFVDDDSCIDIALGDGVDDVLEGELDGIEIFADE